MVTEVKRLWLLPVWTLTPLFHKLLRWCSLGRKFWRRTYSKFTWKFVACKCYLLITFAKSLDQGQARQNVGPDLDPNCLTLWWYFRKIYLKMLILKNSADNKNQQHGKSPNMQTINTTIITAADDHFYDIFSVKHKGRYNFCIRMHKQTL